MVDAEESQARSDGFFREATRCYERAAAVHGAATILRCRIGGSAVELHFASERLAELMIPPLAHLSVPDADEAPFIVRVWDTASTGVEPPTPAWTLDDYGPRGDVCYGIGPHLRAAYSVDAGTLSLFDTATGHAVCWVRDPGQIPPWELAAPLRPIFAWWASATNGQLAHGAAVGEHGVAVLLTAAGGSGKSTTALTCLDAGLTYLGDDYVLLRADTPPTVCSLYSTAKIEPDHLLRVLPHFGALLPRDAPTSLDKVTLRLQDSHASQLVPMLPLCGILITSVAPDGVASVGPATRGEALTAMAPSTIFQLPGAGVRDFARLADIVRRVSCHRLQVGTDPRANVAAIRSVIEACAAHQFGTRSLPAS